MTAGLRQAASRLGAPGWVALALVLLASAVVARSVWRVGEAVLTAAPVQVPAVAQGGSPDLAGLVAQIDGRSPWFVPAPPEPPPVVVERPAEPAGEPPPPARYGGPAVIGVINGSVWLSDGSRVAVGESAGGVEVVGIDGAPWSVRLRWRGVEFDVPLFQRNELIVPAREPGASSAGAQGEGGTGEG